MDDDLEEVRAMGHSVSKMVLLPSRILKTLPSLLSLGFEKQCGFCEAIIDLKSICCYRGQDLVHHPAVCRSFACACLRTKDVWCWSTDVSAKEPASYFTWHRTRRMRASLLQGRLARNLARLDSFSEVGMSPLRISVSFIGSATPR
jgi:hypothetical protein